MYSYGMMDSGAYVRLGTDEQIGKARKIRSRAYVALIYPDCGYMATALAVLAQSDIDYVCILHDMDVEDDGAPKKPHVHVVMRWRNPVSYYGVARRLGLPVNYIQPTCDYASAELYLCHACDLDKYQYPTEALRGPLAEETAYRIHKHRIGVCRDDEEDNVMRILSYIESEPVVSWSGLISWACANHLYGHLRRMGGLAYQLVLERQRLDEAETQRKLSDYRDIDIWHGYIMGRSDNR